MELHHIADDLENHSWYEALFVRTIADVEAYVAAVAEREAVLEDQRPASGSGPI